jgi:WD repeat-containing protein 22
MSVTFNNDGTLLYALRRRLPPVIFKFNQPHAFCQFDAENYVNLCTMKAGCFVGDRDQVFYFSYLLKKFFILYFKVYCIRFR